MKKIAVILAGCGVKDGSEIHESVATLLSLKKEGAEYDCFAPNKKQHHVINHLNEETVDKEDRNMLIEAARIARGDIKEIKEYNPDDYDALIIPGGLGVAKNLFTYALDGVNCEIDKEVKKVILDTYEAKKPIGAICISPVLVTKAFEKTDINPRVTVGDREALMEAVKELGGKPEERKVDEICIDSENKIITTPAYTIAENIAEAASGIEKLVKKIIELS